MLKRDPSFETDELKKWRASIPDDTPHVVVCAAIKCGDVVFTGVRHFCPIMSDQMNRFLTAGGTLCDLDRIQGFIDNRYQFLTREEAYDVAKKAGQINLFRPQSSTEECLYSEDLY